MEVHRPSKVSPLCSRHHNSKKDSTAMSKKDFSSFSLCDVASVADSSSATVLPLVALIIDALSALSFLGCNSPLLVFDAQATLIPLVHYVVSFLFLHGIHGRVVGLFSLFPLVDTLSALLLLECTGPLLVFDAQSTLIPLVDSVVSFLFLHGRVVLLFSLLPLTDALSALSLLECLVLLLPLVDALSLLLEIVCPLLVLDAHFSLLPLVDDLSFVFLHGQTFLLFQLLPLVDALPALSLLESVGPLLVLQFPLVGIFCGRSFKSQSLHPLTKGCSQ